MTQNAGESLFGTASGITRSGADKYPNPFFDIASEYMPSDLNEIFQMCEYLMMTMAPFKAVTGRVARYFLTELVVEGQENDDREKYEDFLKNKLNIISTLGEIGDDFLCLHGDTRVVTRDGVFPIRELSGRTVQVLSDGGVFRDAAFKCYGESEMMRVTFSDGSSVLATPQHWWIVRNGSGRITRVQTRDLTASHRIRRSPAAERPPMDDDYLEGVCHGFVFGDGSTYNRHRRTPRCVANFFTPKDADMLRYFRRYGAPEPIDVRLTGYSAGVGLKKIHGLPSHWKRLPANGKSASYWYGFFSGLFAADGSVDTYGCPVLVQSDREVIRRIAEQLPRIGLVAGRTCVAQFNAEFRRSDGSKYRSSGTSYRLGILKQFARPEDFLLSSHRDRFVARCNPRSRYGRFIGIRSVERTDVRGPVYCCEEPETHSFVVDNGILTGNCYGNSFISVFLPFDRILRCRTCGMEYHCETVAYKFRKGEFSGRCVKCGRDVQFDHIDRRSPDVDRVRIIRWNPKHVRLRVHPVSGRTEYYVELDRQFCDNIRRGKPFYLNDTPWPMVETALRDKDQLFKLKEGSVYHLRAGSLAGLPIRGWGIPPMIPNFKLAYYIQLLRRYDEAITLDYIVPFRVLFPQISAGDGQDALSLMNMGSFAGRMKEMVETHRRRISTVQVSPFPIGYQMLGGEAKQLSPKDNIQLALDELFTAVGYPADLYKGTLSLQAAPVALRLFEKEWCHLVTGYNDIISWLIQIVGRYFRWSDKVEGHLRSVTLADDIERKAITLQAAAGQDISKQTAYQPLGIDYMEEQKRIVQEQTEIQKLQQKAMDEQSAQQLDGSGGENAGPGAVVGATPGDVYAQAGALAQQLLTQTPESMRRSELIKIKHSNPTLHALVLQRMDEIRNQAALQGREMVLQQMGQGG